MSSETIRDHVCDPYHIAIAQRVLDARTPEARSAAIQARDDYMARKGLPPVHGKRDETPVQTVTKPPERDETVTKPGRPKKYASRAEQAKAYRARKKAEG